MMSTATTLSRVTGFVRMWATAFALGATGLMAAYSVANNIPNMIFELVAGGILSSLFIPTFLEVREQRDEGASWEFASHVMNLTVLVLGVVALLGTLFPQPFIWTQTFRMTGGEAQLVRATGSFFFRIFAVQVVVYGGGMVMQGLLNAQRRYLWAALGPVFNNVVVIVTMLAFALIAPSAPETAAIVLAVGTTLGVVVMFAVMVPSLARTGFRWSGGFGLHDRTLRKMLVLAVPTVLYVVTNLVAVSFRNASAFAVAPNGPSVLMYAWTFYQLPYGILAVALATAVFTELAQTAGQKDWSGFKDHFRRGLRLTGVLIIPSAALLFALAEPLVSLYRIGRFTASDVPIVAGALRGWAVALVFFACTMFVLRTFYSLQDTRTPMLANLGLTAVQIGLYYALATGIGSWPGIGINGIPIADAIFYALLFATLSLLLRRRIGGYDLRGIAATYGGMLVSAVIGAAAAWAVARLLSPLVGGVAGSLLQVFAGGAIGLVLSFAVARALRVPEAAAGSALVRRIARKAFARRGKGA